MKNKKVYIVYKYNDFKNDFEYIKEYYSIKELMQNENISLRHNNSIFQFIVDDIEKAKHLLKDKYIIIKEEL